MTRARAMVWTAVTVALTVAAIPNRAEASAPEQASPTLVETPAPESMVPAPRPSLLPPGRGVVLTTPCARAVAGTTAEERTAAADAQLVRAVDHFESDDFVAALTMIDVAECYEPRPVFDYMRSVIHAGLGNCLRARTFATRFEASGPAEIDRVALQGELGACRAVPPPPRPPRPPAALPTSLHAFDDPGAPPRAVPSPPRNDILAGVLLGGGLVTVVVGVTVVAVVRPREIPASYAGYEAQLTASRRGRIAGGLLIGAGTSLVAGSVIRYLVLRHRAARSP